MLTTLPRATFPPCPSTLPASVSDVIRVAGTAWAAHPDRPVPSRDIQERWRQLLGDWTEDVGMPLYVRKFSDNRGSVVQHHTGRQLIPCDNSPALWAYTVACRGECPTREDVRALIEADQIPVAFAFGSGERLRAIYKAALASCPSPTQAGWKLGHLDSIGLNVRGSVEQLPIAALTQHFVSLLSPANMFVVPKAWAGFAELPEVIEAMRAWERDREMTTPTMDERP
jgi:hypothetical protein